VLARAHGQIDLGQDEIHGLIHQIENRALVNLIERNRLVDLGAVEMGALDLGRNKEALRRDPEKKDRGMGGPAFVEQLQMLQHIARVGILRERKPAGSARGSQKPRDFICRKIVHRGVPAGGGVKGTEADQFLYLQVLD